jgi:hypothetical protein
MIISVILMVPKADGARQLENPQHEGAAPSCFAGDVLAAGSCVDAFPLAV